MPVLTIIIPNSGKEVVIAGSVPVDHYLAKKFSLLGLNEWEEITIKVFYNNIQYLHERLLTRVTFTYADKRKERLEMIMKVALPTFVENHEFHLRANGSNGHYLGDQLS
ncbi:hypothetical protein EC991_008607 [Linnemannia zychae]|nr:hypothetical protein EC991_008607 [Linnemannia zychae]